jgi:FkbM family methyltransferase
MKTIIARESIRKLGFFRPFLRKFIERRGYRIYRPNPYAVFDFESFLMRYLEVHKSLNYLQIGANDGVMNDPMFRFVKRNSKKISGWLLEPIPEVFKNLVSHYSAFKNIQCFNFAIHNTNATMSLYRVKPELESKLPEFSKGIASFDLNHFKKTGLVPDNSYMESILVKCITLSDFLSENKIDSVDLMVIDTEGYDYKILLSLLDTNLRPRIIRFEHGVRNQIMEKSEFLEICRLLNLNGYQVVAESYDATAYILDPSDLIF